jgi:acetone carboxylase gamma subunit
MKYPTVQKIFAAEESQTEYKLRAEALVDVVRLLEQVPTTQYKIICDFQPDVELEFKSKESLEQIKNAMKDIPDSHVMLETVALAKDYTGERQR